MCTSKIRGLLLFLFSFFGLITFGQTVENIDSLKLIIDNSVYSDSISVIRSSKSAIRPVLVKAFLKGDTLLKTIASYANSSRLRIAYYEYEDASHSTPLYVKDIDSLTNTVLLEVYGKDGNVFKSAILQTLDTLEAKFPSLVLDNSNFSIDVGFALVDRQAKKYSFTGKLVKAVPLSPGCGTIAWLLSKNLKSFIHRSLTATESMY